MTADKRHVKRIEEIERKIRRGETEEPVPNQLSLDIEPTELIIDDDAR